MAIECYYSTCPHHSSQTGEEGPFCYEKECVATAEEIYLFIKVKSIEHAKYEDLHYSKRLIKVLDAMDEEALYDDTLWPNRRHSEMFGFIWGTKDIKGCFH